MSYEESNESAVKSFDPVSDMLGSHASQSHSSTPIKSGQCLHELDGTKDMLPLGQEQEGRSDHWEVRTQERHYALLKDKKTQELGHGSYFANCWFEDIEPLLNELDI